MCFGYDFFNEVNHIFAYLCRINSERFASIRVIVWISLNDTMKWKCSSVNKHGVGFLLCTDLNTNRDLSAFIFSAVMM